MPDEVLTFGEGLELDRAAYELRRGGLRLKLERIPMETLLLLVERRGQLVTRDDIVGRIWGKDVFLDTDTSINSAIRKIRQVLKDDPENPAYIQTVTGMGYRFVAPISIVAPGSATVPVQPAEVMPRPAPGIDLPQPASAAASPEPVPARENAVAAGELDTQDFELIPVEPPDKGLATRRTFLPTAAAAGAVGGGDSSATTVKPESSSEQRRKFFWAFAGVSLIILVAAAFLWRYKLAATNTAPRVARFVIPLTEQERQDNAFDSIAMAPDGTRIAIAGTVGGVPHILLRLLQDMSTQVLSGTENATYPFFSPDSQWIGFFADGKLKKVPVGGGAPDVLADASGARGGDWGDNGIIVFSPFARGKGIYEVNADGGDPKPITTLDTANGETSHRLPHLLPGGKTLLFAAYGATYDDVDIIAQSLQTGERKVLIKGATQPGYVSTGHLLYVQPKLPDTLMAVAFSPAELKLTGPPVPVVNGLLSYGRGADWTISREGTMVYAPGGLRGTENLLTWVDRKGRVQPSAMPSKPYGMARISPDGKRIAYTLNGGTTDIWVYDSTARTAARFTFTGNNGWPLWTPDGKGIIFASNRSRPWNLYWKSADGSGQEKLLRDDPGGQYPMSISPDGKWLSFNMETPTTLHDIWVLPLDGQGPARAWLHSPAVELDAKFSPDGKWMSYCSNESGRFEIYVRPFPGPGEERQISADGGTEPVWAHSGRELFYRNGDKMMAVDIRTDSGFQAGTPHVLFAGPYEPSNVLSTNYDVSPDDQHFLMIEPKPGSRAPLQLNVILNWFEELKQKVPADK